MDKKYVVGYLAPAGSNNSPTTFDSLTQAVEQAKKSVASNSPGYTFIVYEAVVGFEKALPPVREVSFERESGRGGE